MHGYKPPKIKPQSSKVRDAMAVKKMPDTETEILEKLRDFREPRQTAGGRPPGSIHLNPPYAGWHARMSGRVARCSVLSVVHPVCAAMRCLEEIRRAACGDTGFHCLRVLFASPERRQGMYSS